jgi:hypothetical protein
VHIYSCKPISKFCSTALEVSLTYTHIHACCLPIHHFMITNVHCRKWDSAQLHYQRASHLFKANTNHDSAADRSLLSAADAAAEGRKYVVAHTYIFDIFTCMHTLHTMYVNCAYHFAVRVYMYMKGIMLIHIHHEHWCSAQSCSLDSHWRCCARLANQCALL